MVDSKLIIGVIVALVIVLGAAYALSSGGGGEETSSNQTSQNQNQTSGGTGGPGSPTGGQSGGGTGSGAGSGGSSGTSGGTQVDMTGEWEGTYTSGYGNGEWKLKVQRTNMGYVGCMLLSGPYNSTEWFGVQINVNGNQVTVTFPTNMQTTVTGTVSGDHMSGTWSVITPNGQDGGQWTGTRISTTVSSMPCLGSGTPGGGEGGGGSEGGNETNQTQPGGGSGGGGNETNETTPTIGSLADQIAQYVLQQAGIQEQAILVGNQTGSMPTPYGTLTGVSLTFNVSGDVFNVSQHADLLNTLGQYLQSQGYIIMNTETPTPNYPYLSLTAVKYGQHITMITISIDSTMPPNTIISVDVGST